MSDSIHDQKVTALTADVFLLIKLRDLDRPTTQSNFYKRREELSQAEDELDKVLEEIARLNAL